jgi:hypothetical protein
VLHRQNRFFATGALISLIGAADDGLRASTLIIHVNSLISRPMQCHIEFLMMWRREKEVVASRNNHLMNETTTS